MKRTSEHILNEWLVLLAQQGKERAMEALLRQWHPKLVRYASYQVNDGDAAQDIVIHLYYLDGFDLNEIASVIDIPVGTIKSRLHSARKQLRHLYNLDDKIGEKDE